MQPKRYFVTGIGTDVGKTVVSAILVHALKADYWKPIQAGDTDLTDAQKVKHWCGADLHVYHPEAYLLPFPLSPHASAARAGLEIQPETIQVPKHRNPLVIEGAGGLLVPLTLSTLLIDLIPSFEAEVILVSRHYLGSINHTLLSIDALRMRNIPIKGIILNGHSNPETESAIAAFGKVPFLGRIDQTDQLTPEFIHQQSLQFSWL